MEKSLKQDTDLLQHGFPLAETGSSFTDLVGKQRGVNV